MKSSKILIYILILIVLAFVAYKISQSNLKSKSTVPDGKSKVVSQIEGIIVKTSKIEQEIEVSGTILPFDETVLMPEVAGRVVQLNLKEGKTVTKGTLLIKLFDDDLQAQLKMLQVQLKIAENTESRMKKLLDISGTSQQEFDASLLQVSNLKAQIDILKVSIGKTEIRAPYTGEIGLKKISIGQYISPSTPIVTIRSINSLKLDFHIPEKYSSKMQNGTKIDFTVAGSDHPFQAQIIATEESIDADSRNLKVRSIVLGNTKGLLPGAFAKVKANLGSNNNAIMIPTSAIVPQARDKKVIISSEGKAKLVTVKTGVRQAGSIEVISGIKPGDTVVTTGILFIKPNTGLIFSIVK